MIGTALLGMAALIASPAPPAETIIEAPGPLGALSGTMLAAGSGPVVLIIPGSGPTDRDGNSPLGIQASTYRLLAEGLAKRGISSVRIDKRGMFGSKAAVADANAVTMSDYASDVRSWTSAIRERTGKSCVWLLGHSEGGLVALLAAQEAGDICGLILVAAPGRPLGDILREQLRANPANAPVLDQALAAIDRLEQGERVDTSDMHPALLPLFAPQVQGFLMNQLSLDPAELAAKVETPMLIVQGGRDIQVSEADAQRLKQANENAQLVVIPDANHVLKAVASDDRAANARTYADPDLPLAPGVIDVIADFVTAK